MSIFQIDAGSEIRRVRSDAAEAMDARIRTLTARMVATLRTRGSDAAEAANGGAIWPAFEQHCPAEAEAMRSEWAKLAAEITAVVSYELFVRDLVRKMTMDFAAAYPAHAA